MLKVPKMANFISSKYVDVKSDETHYALDFTTDVAGGVKDYLIHNTVIGTVIKNGYFTDNVTTCVSITNTKGI